MTETDDKECKMYKWIVTAGALLTTIMFYALIWGGAYLVNVCEMQWVEVPFFLSGLALFFTHAGLNLFAIVIWENERQG